MKRTRLAVLLLPAVLAACALPEISTELSDKPVRNVKQTGTSLASRPGPRDMGWDTGVKYIGGAEIDELVRRQRAQMDPMLGSPRGP